MLMFLLLTTANSHAVVNTQAIEVGSQDMNGNFPIIAQIISWTENDTDPNPCYSESTECYIGPDVLYEGGEMPSLNGSCNYSNNCIEISKLKTKKEVLDKYTSRFGIPKIAQFNISAKTYDCVSMFYSNGKPYSNGGIIVQMWPGSICGKIPPTTLVCNTDLPAEINHGLVNIRSLSNNASIFSDEIEVRTWCNSNSDVKFKLYVTNYKNTRYLTLNNDDTLFSEILIDNKSGFDGVELIVKPGPSGSISRLKSRLFASSIATLEAKEYSGSVLITAAYE